MATDLELAYNALVAKKRLYDILFNYYHGLQPLIYSRDRLKEIFKDISARFTQNWCAVVVDSTMERIQLREFTIAKDEAGQKALNELAQYNELSLEADAVHLASLITGEAFIVAWKEDGEEYPEAYYNDPRLCHAFYSSENPREMRFAVKCWFGDDGYIYKNLYYPDRIEYYITNKKVSSMADVTDHKSFIPAEIAVADNPFGIIPVFHFRRERCSIRSELANVIEPQDAINKLLADMMVAAEFGAFPQRWAITEANIKGFKNAPNEIWRFPPAADGEQPVSTGEFSTSSLDNYIKGVDKFANSIAIITRTPKHYFFGQGGDPSGEALIAMESPLNKKCQKYIDRFSSTWRQLAHFMLLLQGVNIKPFDIAATFDKPETVQPYTEALTRKTNFEAGIPLATILRDDGWTEAEIKAMEADKAAEGDAQQTQLASALVKAQRGFDQNSNGNGNGANSNQSVQKVGVNNGI